MAYLSNQIWQVGVNNAARIIQKLFSPKSCVLTNMINNNNDNNNNDNNNINNDNNTDSNKL